MMQSPEPSMGSPNQPYSNNSTSYSPTRNMTSPIGHPLGSPMRQFSGYQQGPPSVGQQGGPPTTPSPHRFPQSPHSIPAQSPHPVAPSPQMVPPSSQTIPPSPSSSSQPRTTSANPFSPPVSAAPTTHRTVTTNGPSSSSPVPSPTKPTEIPAKLVIDEEPLPQYPTPEELERMAQHVRPMIPYSLTEKIMSKAGVQFADPKIGNLISFAGQSLIVDIVKEVAGMSKGLPKPQDKQLMRANLERVLQDRGMKVLPPDPTPTLLK
ncbi:hypothetical protein RvY_15432 [Ramazzottius varieornatus]|uniref:Uncharacterized protein n=1 Tax=Ramazzottius varieornatus TaxID=947166 RepID=A0A1D1VUX0_RAMVA|nr:hypothetical protein RvY_15432 [Ramazzottius varieornatus]